MPFATPSIVGIPYNYEMTAYGAEGETAVARILIVDDDDADLLLMGSLLTRAGHTVSLAQDGEEALRVFREAPADVVITDLQMPKVHGLELISVLRDTSPRPAIIVISGTGEAQLDIASAVGADAALTKPISPDALLDWVRGMLAPTDDQSVDHG